MSSKKDLKTITAAPISVEIDGRSLKAAPLTIGDLGDLESWMQETHIAKKIATMRAADFDNRDIMAMIDAGSSISMSSHEGQSMLRTASGVLYLMFLSLRRYQPDLTYEDIKGFNVPVTEMNEVGGKILELSFATKKELNEKNSKPAKRTKE